MTPKEKAKKIYRRYFYILNDARIAKRCALISVDEILKSNRAYHSPDSFLGTITYDDMLYWEQVKKEIENI